jgi:hypothetical protein
MRAGMGLVLSAFVGGCGDLDGVPLVSIETDAPVPALQLGRDLPSLPTLVARWGGGIPLEVVTERWTESWILPEEEGEQARMESNQAVVLLLAPHLPEGELERSVGQVAAAVEALESALEGRDLEALGGPVAAAVSAAHRAADALEEGAPTHALRWALTASDHLRKATPEVLARTLIREVEAELQRWEWIPPDEARPESGVVPLAPGERAEVRVRRLLVGAEEALVSEDYPRALRRAWYAMGLMEALRSGTADTGPDPDLWEER